MNEIVTQNTEAAGEIDFVGQPSNIFDVERFEMVSKVAQVMSRASLIPDHMKVKDDPDATFSNCFIVANLSLTWGFDPFLVAQAVSILYGKMVLEGKLVRSVIKKSLGLDLSYRFFGNPGDMKRCVYVSDSPLVDNAGVPLEEAAIKGLIEQGSRRITTGTLEKWHTKKSGGAGINDNWAKDEDKMFRERGSREWCRQWAPGLILGIYTPDEFDEQSDDYRATKARNVTPASGAAVNPLLDDKSRSRQSVNVDRIDGETGEIIEASRAQGSTSRSTASQAKADNRSGGQVQRLPGSKFQEYGKALVRCVNADNLKPTHDSFWKGAAPDSGPDYDLARAIYSVHSERLKNGSDATAAIAAVTKLIEKEFPL